MLIFEIGYAIIMFAVVLATVSAAYGNNLCKPDVYRGPYKPEKPLDSPTRTEWGWDGEADFLATVEAKDNTSV